MKAANGRRGKKKTTSASIFLRQSDRVPTWSKCVCVGGGLLVTHFSFTAVRSDNEDGRRKQNGDLIQTLNMTSFATVFFWQTVEICRIPRRSQLSCVRPLSFLMHSATNLTPFNAWKTNNAAHTGDTHACASICTRWL